MLHGVATPAPTTPWLVVEPVPHQYPALQAPVQPAVARPALAPNVPAGHGIGEPAALVQK
jgi:hypothetical protein